MSTDLQSFTMNKGSTVYYGGEKVRLGKFSYVTKTAQLFDNNGNFIKNVNINDINPFRKSEDFCTNKIKELKIEYEEKSTKSKFGLKNYFICNENAYDFKIKANKIIGNSSFDQLSRRNQVLYTSAINGYKHNKKLAFEYDTIFTINNWAAGECNESLRMWNNQLGLVYAARDSFR